MRRSRADAADHIVMTGAWINLPAVLVTLACTALLIAGTRKSAMVNSVIVVAKVLAILVLVAACLPHIDTRLGIRSCRPTPASWAISAGRACCAARVSCSSPTSALTGYRRWPRRPRTRSATMPLSLGLSLAICTALYVAVSLAVTGIADYHLLNVPDPLYQALSLAHANLSWLKVLVAVVAGFGLIPVISLSLLGQIRIFYAMGRDGLLPPRCRAVASAFTPRISAPWSPA